MNVSPVAAVPTPERSGEVDQFPFDGYKWAGLGSVREFGGRKPGQLWLRGDENYQQEREK